MKKLLEVKFKAYGHPQIAARDPNKIIITKRNDVYDDSVIAVCAELGAADLPENFKIALRERKKVTLLMHTAGTEDLVEAFGSYKMKLTDSENMIFTKSDFVDPATVGVRANKSANDLLRNLVALLQVEGQEIILTLRVIE